MAMISQNNFDPLSKNEKLTTNKIFSRKFGKNKFLTSLHLLIKKMCLKSMRSICNTAFAHNKISNIKHHYETKLAHFSSSLNSQKEIKLSSLK